MMSRKVLWAALPLGVATAAAAWWMWTSGEEPSAEPEVEYRQQLDRVALSAEQVRLAGIRVAEAERKTLQPTRTIPGRLDYDQERHVAVKAGCDGVIRQLLVRPGDQVQAGQAVAVISCPEVGAARAEISQRQVEYELARSERQWRETIRQGVEKLVGLIRENASPEEMETRMAEDDLGDYRQELLAAYMQWKLASQISANIRDAAAAGAVAGRVQQERDAARRTAAAGLEAEIEQTLFDARQQSKLAEARCKFAEQQLSVSRQKLINLLGPAAVEANPDAEAQAEKSPETNSPDAGDSAASGDSQRLSDVVLAAPIDGAIEDRQLSEAERIAAGQTLLIVADTRRLWAVADVRERDWATIALRKGEAVQVRSPAVPDATYAAEVLFVGRSVDARTGAAPLVAQLEQADPRLRPGLFLRMTAPVGQPLTALFVPEAAVVVHEGASFVFQPLGDNQFRRVDVRTGITIDGWTEIQSGLQEGDPLVVEGAFPLKSQLLLAGEEE